MSSKIKVYDSNGCFLVWNADDALKLRKDHRVLGKAIGYYPGRAYQVNENGLPLQLMKEEVRLLLDLQIVDLVKVTVNIDKNTVTSYNQHLETVRSEYNKLARERRLEDIETHTGSDQGQKRKREISNEKMNDLLSVQLFTESPWPQKDEVMNDEWSYPQTEREKLLFITFQDLWKRGHYITCGLKFGCDYLVYEFDPLVVHAKYMVKCQSQTDDLTGLQILILSRISTQVNKQLLIASLDNQDEVACKDAMSIRKENNENNLKPIYISINWQKN